LFKKPPFNKSTLNKSTFKDARPKARSTAPQLNKVAIALSLGALSLTGCSAGPATGAAAVSPATGAAHSAADVDRLVAALAEIGADPPHGAAR